MKTLSLFILTALLSGCAFRQRWHSSEAAYDRWMIRQCSKQCDYKGQEQAECLKSCDPNWKPCPDGTRQAGEQICQ